MDIKPYPVFEMNEVLPLYESVGWTSYTGRPEMLKTAFSNSLLVLGAYESHRLIGLLRAVGDGASVLYIQDLLVHPDFQRRGIGKRLIREAMAAYPDVYQIVLLTDDTQDNLAFYEGSGLTKAADLGLTAFVRIKR